MWSIASLKNCFKPISDLPDTLHLKIEEYPSLQSCKIYIAKACRVTSKLLWKISEVAIVAQVLGMVATVVTRLNPEANPNFYKSICVIPVVEEVMFRGVIQNSIGLFQAVCQKKSFSEKPPELLQMSGRQRALRVGITTALFVIVHLWNQGDPVHLTLLSIRALTAGVFYGYLLEKTHGLVMPILAHSGWNAVDLLFESQLCFVGITCVEGYISYNFLKKDLILNKIEIQ